MNWVYVDHKYSNDPKKLFFNYMYFAPCFQLLGHLMLVARNMAEKENLQKGYRVGKDFFSFPSFCWCRL
jgi:hypothetical protein